jgi:hypothetical protein
MAFGLRVRRPDNGAVLLDTSTSMTRILGTVLTTANTAGALSHPGFATGLPFAVVNPTSQITPNDTYPSASVDSNGVLSWTAATITVLIIYGVRS